MNVLFRSIGVLFLLLQFDSYGQIDPGKIEIVRDNYGVPHIYASTDAEVAYGLAWAHAEDNFKTIQETFLPAVGKLGLLKGKDGAVLDYVTRLLRCREAAKNNIEELSPEVLAVIKGYVDGINAYANAHPNEVLVKKSFPLTVLDYLTGYNLVIHFFSDSGETLQSLFGDRITPLSDISSTDEQKTIGSNAFAISSKKTEDGKTYLNVNTHQPLEGPFSWYEAHLISQEGWNMLGALFPGSPFPMIGTNKNLGWTHTFNYPDLVDIFQLKMHPSDKNKYELDGKWVDLEVEKVKIKIKIWSLFNLSTKRKAYWSIHGPVVKNKSGFFAFRSNALNNIQSIDQWYQMNKSTNLQEFMKALKMQGLPRFNVMYADRMDNIYYLSSGKIPKRKSGYNWSGVVPGHISEIIPNTFVPIEELPQILNPSKGYLFNTNNSPFNAAFKSDNVNPSDYDSLIGYKDLDNNRSKRFEELIAQFPSLNYDEFKRIKYDIQYPDSLVGLFQLNDVFYLDPTAYPEFAQFIEIIQNWDRKANVENLGAAQWCIYYNNLLKLADKYNLYDSTEIQDSIIIEALNLSKEYLMKHFTRMDIQLKDYQLHCRGVVEMPLPGLVDMIAAMTSSPYKDGKVKGVSGESYIMLVRYDENTVEIETVLPYGQSTNENNPHFTDQMEMYVNQQLKKMTFDDEEIRKNAEQVYNPKIEN